MANQLLHVTGAAFWFRAGRCVLQRPRHVSMVVRRFHREFLLMKIKPRPLTIPTLIALLASIVMLNTVGFPFCQNPARRPFTAYGGNDFGWPFTYLSTNFTASQRQQMRMPAGGYAFPASVAIKPTELFSDQEHDIVTFSRVGLASNLAAWCAILLYAGVVLELWQRQSRRSYPFTVRTILIMMTWICLTAGLSRSGMFYRWCYLQNYYLWALGKQLVFVAALCIGVALATRYWNQVRRHGSYRTPNAA